jgi:hypothetical protein
MPHTSSQQSIKMLAAEWDVPDEEIRELLSAPQRFA